MNITCPQCQFSRQVPADKLPTASTMATCPQCQFRFKVHIENEQAPAPSEVEVSPQSVEAPISEPTPAPQQEEPNVPKYIPSKEAAAQSYAAEQEQRVQQQAQQERAEDTFDQDAAFEAFAIENPWENPERTGYFSAFYQTVLRVLFSAPRFFAGLMPQGSQKRALLFFVIIGLLQITFERFWGDIISEALAPAAADDPQLQTMLNMLTPQSSYSLALLLGGALNVVEIFFTTTVYYVLFRFITPQRADFNLIFQVVAYGAAPMLLCLVPALGSVVGYVWTIACTAVGCRYALRLTWGQTLLGILPMYLIGVPLLLQFMFVA